MLKFKNVILVIFILSYSLNVVAQAPKWLNANYRSMKYSGEVYLTAFTQDEKYSSETRAEALDRVKDIARSDIAKNLITKIESVSKLYIEDVTVGNSESFKEIFKTAIKTETKADINGIKTDSYYDEEKNSVYAFAYANRYQIMGYYNANIGMNIQQVEGYIAAAEQFVAVSEKSKAKKEYLKTVALFAKLEYAQGLLIAVDKNADENSLQTKKSINLRNKVNKALAELEQGIYVLIQCKAQLFDYENSILENKLKSQLAKQGCSFTTDKEEADWIITIDAKARKFTNPHNSIYFSYVDAVVNLVKKHKNQNVYQDEITQKGGSRDYKAAAKKAYQEIAGVIAKNILKWINK